LTTLCGARQCQCQEPRVDVDPWMNNEGEA